MFGVKRFMQLLDEKENISPKNAISYFDIAVVSAILKLKKDLDSFDNLEMIAHKA